MCQNGRIPNPELQHIILPTETYFKTLVRHDDSAINVLCEVQRKVRCFKDGILFDPENHREDVTLYRNLQARTDKAGLFHDDDGPRQAGVPSGKNYAVYVDVDLKMKSTFKAPKRSPCARLAKMPKPKRAPTQPQHEKFSAGDRVLAQRSYSIYAYEGIVKERTAAGYKIAFDGKVHIHDFTVEELTSVL